MAPRVSVLIPVYNAQATVELAVNSIVRQTFADFEVVIVNDGSTDATPDVLESVRKRDGRVRIVQVQQGGIIQALNTGVALCEGGLIARMDGDDVSHPRRLQMQVELMDARPDISVCSSLIRMFPRSNVLGGMQRYEHWMNSVVTSDAIATDMFIESPVAHPSVMMRTRELVELGGYQEHGWAEDYDLWLRYHTAGKRFAKVERALVCWRQGEGRLTFTDSRYSVENFLRAKAHYLAAMPAVHERPVVLWGAGQTGRRLLKHLERSGVSIEAVIDVAADKIGHTLRGKPIVGDGYLKSNPGAFVISAVSSHSARELIRERLRQLGLVELRDFVCAA